MTVQKNVNNVNFNSFYEQKFSNSDTLVKILVIIITRIVMSSEWKSSR